MSRIRHERKARGLTQTALAFFKLYREGFSRYAMASNLQLSSEEVDELFDVMEEPRASLEGEEGIATQGVGVQEVRESNHA